MIGLDFLDANVLVYAYDLSSPRKLKIARELLFRGSMSAVVSAQVLAEFSNVLLHKRRPGVDPAEVLKALHSFAHIEVVVPDRALVMRAVEVKERYGLHVYDGMIIAAAERGGCARIYSEDLNSGQRYFGIEVVNPFQ